MTVGMDRITAGRQPLALSQRERVGRGRNALYCQPRHTPAPFIRRPTPGFWIPAYAGMTVGRQPLALSQRERVGRGRNAPDRQPRPTAPHPIHTPP